MHVQRMADGGLLWHPSLVSPSLLRTAEHWSGHEPHNQVSALQPPVRLQSELESCCWCNVYGKEASISFH